MIGSVLFSCLIDRLYYAALQSRLQLIISINYKNLISESILSLKRETFESYSLAYAQAVSKYVCVTIFCSFLIYNIVVTFLRLGRFAHIREYKIWLQPDIFFQYSSMKKEQDKYIKILNTLTSRIINERKEQLELHLETNAPLEGNSEESTVFLDNLLLAKDENGERLLSDEDIRDEVNTLLFAVSTIGLCIG